MIITLTRSGGFTGIPQKKTIDTNTLQPEKAKEIEALVERSNLLASEEGRKHGFVPTKPQPDRFSYTITIQNDSISGSLAIHEESLNPEMQELIDCLQNS